MASKLSTGIEPVLIQTDKSCIVSIYYTQFSTNINKNHIINTSFVRPGIRPLGANKTGFNLINFHFDICGKLSIIRNDRNILKQKKLWDQNYQCLSYTRIVFYKLLTLLGIFGMPTCSVFPICEEYPVLHRVSHRVVVSAIYTLVEKIRVHVFPLMTNAVTISHIVWSRNLPWDILRLF